MAWEARLGLKPYVLNWTIAWTQGLNGLGSPFGIETIIRLDAAEEVKDG